MKSFMEYNFNINKIVVACHVPEGFGPRIHKNRPSHGLAFFVSGSKTFRFDNGLELDIKKNEIIHLPKYSNYEVISNVPGECYSINFDFDEDITFDPFVIPIKSHNTMLDFYRDATKVWELKTNGYDLKCKAELYNVLYLLASEYHSEYVPTYKHEIIKPAVEFIHNNYITDTPSIEFLSQMCGITPEYFRKIFKNIYGISPLKYINNLKLNKAKELIQSQMYTITDAALQSGYTDISHFSREFKKATGVCPSKYI